MIRRLVRGSPRMGGVEKVFANLCLGLDRLGIQYSSNLPFEKLRDSDRVAVLGRGRYSLQGYERANPIVAGIGLMGHPSEWPTLLEDYPVVRYLQHSEWANEVYRPYFADRCGIWPVGIDTRSWIPSPGSKDVNIVLYDKVRWERPRYERTLIQPIRDLLLRKKLKFAELRYGFYDEAEYRDLLARSKAMIFLCEHESQGLAYQECLSCDIPVLAWDQGYCLDPNRFNWGNPEIPATSVPYFDERCGAKFRDMEEFPVKLDWFLEQIRKQEFKAREYILEHLTLESCSRRFVDILDEDLPT